MHTDIRMTVSLGCIHDYVRADDVHSAQQCPSQIGTTHMYLPSPEPVVYVVPGPLSHILGKLPLIPAGDHCCMAQHHSPNYALPHCRRKDACYPRGVCYRQGDPGSGSPLFYIIMWVIV